MNEYSDTVLYRLRFVFVGTLMIASLFLLAFLVSVTANNSVQAKTTTSSAEQAADTSNEDPNIVSNGLLAVMDGLNKTIDSMAAATTNSAQAAASATVDGGEAVGRAAQTGTKATARGVGRSLAFVFSIPGNIIGFVTKSNVVGSVIRPSDHEESVPIIDPDSPELLAAISAMPATKDANPALPQNNAGPVWPIHGEITAEFGVPHWPYQPTHTGIDISDGQPRGVTQVRPFRPGKVIEAVHSNFGFGNHVIIDHGNGVTSLYGHLDSFSVQVGQEVTTATVIGFEGTTGLSTGVHLHFEIRVNGQAANPHQFVSGQP